MYHTYFFQKRLAEALHMRMQGMYLQTVFSQQKDELVLQLAYKQDLFTLRANLDNQAGLLTFPDRFARARKNSVDLFEELIDQKVEEVFPLAFERSFVIRLQHHQLIFKMHGQRSNVLLVQAGEVVRLFRNGLSGDWSVSLDTLKGQPPDSWHACQALLGAFARNRLDEAEWTSFIKDFEHGPIHLVKDVQGQPHISLLNETQPLFTTYQPLEASNKLAEYFYADFQLAKEKKPIVQQLTQQIKRGSNYIQKTANKLQAVRKERNPEEYANILMANLHHLQAGPKKGVLDDLYGDGKVTIAMNPVLSPQKNAERYYRKGKNKSREIKQLELNLEKKEQQINQWQAEIKKVEEIQNLKDLRARYPKSEGSSKLEEVLPYHEFTWENYRILVGRNAKANDELTLRVAHKDDLWLHAKDVAGSHVVVRHRAGQNFPEPVIERAAALAAFFSKRKTDTLCPVSYTPKKHVRKAKGAPPGQVIVTKEEVIMVKPENWQNKH